MSNQVRISAHAGHSPSAENRTIQAYRQAAATNADLVETDIRRTADGEHVAFHDPRTSQGHLLSTVEYAQLCYLAGYEVPKIADVLATIKGRAKGHLDLKETGDEAELVRLALDILGPGEFVITSAEDASVAAIRARFPDAEQVPVALSLGRGMRPLPRVRACGADWAALNHRIALAGVARQCRRHQVKVMVWTVNNEREIQYWLSHRRTDVLITDRPALAVAIRDQTASGDPRSR
jgi:glycerophosphoryl diester phosphodiesterase